jgi:hypothetical protein
MAVMQQGQQLHPVCGDQQQQQWFAALVLVVCSCMDRATGGIVWLLEGLH